MTLSQAAVNGTVAILRNLAVGNTGCGTEGRNPHGEGGTLADTIRFSKVSATALTLVGHLLAWGQLFQMTGFTHSFFLKSFTSLGPNVSVAL